MRDALIYYLDIDTPPGQSFFKQLVVNSCVDDENDLKEVINLSKVRPGHKICTTQDAPVFEFVLPIIVNFSNHSINQHCSFCNTKLAIIICYYLH